jgi:sugar/nucleoside kinase (ribokinase family)
VIDLLVLGDCNPDLLVVVGDDAPRFGQGETIVDAGRLQVGGSAAIAACAASRLGLSTAMVGAVGGDLMGRFMLDELAARGVDASACPVLDGVDTGITVALVRGGDRAILTAPGAIARMTAEMVPEPLLLSARHVHTASYHLVDGLRPGLPGLLERARAAGATVSVDPQGEVGGASGAELRGLAPLVDVLFVNEAEHRQLGPVDVPLVVVKRGAAGAVAHTADGEVAATAPAVEVVDATGAGDCFDAGFLAGRAAGLDLHAALALACACGALSTRALGGVAAQPTMEEARAAMT